jgi:hypothetical protein
MFAAIGEAEDMKSPPFDLNLADGFGAFVPKGCKLLRGVCKILVNGKSGGSIITVPAGARSWRDVWRERRYRRVRSVARVWWERE